jgi:hypothetical protein
VRAQADPDSSNAEKKLCETNGLYRDLDSMQESPGVPDDARVSRPLRLLGSGAGLAQASQSAAGIWLTDGRDSRMISDDAISDLGTGHALRSAIAVVTNSVEDRALRARVQEQAARIR